MAALVETPEQEIQHLLGKLMWENVGMAYEIERLKKRIADLERPNDDIPWPKSL